MTAKEFLQNKYPQMRGYLWNSNPNIDDEWVAKMMEEYAEQVNGVSTGKGQSNIPDVSNRRELLIAFASELQKIGFNEMDSVEKVVDIYLKSN